MINYFFNNQAKKIYKNLKGELSHEPNLDETILVSYANLQAQELQLQLQSKLR